MVVGVRDDWLMAEAAAQTLRHRVETDLPTYHSFYIAASLRSGRHFQPLSDLMANGSQGSCSCSANIRVGILQGLFELWYRRGCRFAHGPQHACSC